MKIALINNQTTNCGVNQLGKQLFNAMKKHSTYTVNYYALACLEDFLAIKNELERHDIVIFNYYPMIMPWIDRELLDNCNFLPVCINHEFDYQSAYVVNSELFNYRICLDPSFSSRCSNVATLPRIIKKAKLKHHSNKVFTIGSFGFATPGKNFAKLIDFAYKNFTEVIVKIHMAASTYGDPDSAKAKEIEQQMATLLADKNITLEVSYDFMDSDALLNWLNDNDLNIFIYSNTTNRGISSVLDWALAVDVPIALSSSIMFRHIKAFAPELFIADNTIESIIDSGVGHVKRLRKLWSAKKVIKQLDQILKDFQLDSFKKQSARYNTVLTDNMREYFNDHIEEIAQLCPEMHERKIERANIQQAFVKAKVEEFANKKSKMLCVGYNEDTAYFSLKQKGYNVIGIDPLFDMDLATFYEQCDCIEKYDIIFSTSVIEHVPNDIEFISQIADLLMPGGYAVITMDYNNSYKNGDPLPTTDERFYTIEHLLTNFIPNLGNCQLVGCYDWQQHDPDFTYENIDYSFASLVFRKNKKPELNHHNLILNQQKNNLRNLKANNEILIQESSSKDNIILNQTESINSLNDQLEKANNDLNQFKSSLEKQLNTQNNIIANQAESISSLGNVAAILKVMEGKIQTTTQEKNKIVAEQQDCINSLHDEINNLKELKYKLDLHIQQLNKDNNQLLDKKNKQINFLKKEKTILTQKAKELDKILSSNGWKYLSEVYRIKASVKKKLNSILGRDEASNDIGTTQKHNNGLVFHKKLLDTDDLDFSKFKGQRVLNISPWGTKCGIATYCKALRKGLDSLDLFSANDIIVLDHKKINNESFAKNQKFYDDIIKKCASYDLIFLQHEFLFFASSQYSIKKSIKLFSKFLQVLSKKCPQSQIIVHVHTPVDMINNFNANFSSGIEKYLYEISKLKNVKLIGNVMHIVNDLAQYKIHAGVGFDPVKSFLYQAHEYKEDIAEKVRQKLSIKPGDYVMSILGFINEPKGHLEVIEVMKKLPKNYKLLVIGGVIKGDDDSYYQKLLSKSQEYNLENRVYITGRFDDEDLDTYGKLSDVMLAPYSNVFRWGSSSITEMIRFQKPVIAYDIDSFKIVNNHCAYQPLVLVESENRKALKKAIIEYTTNKKAINNKINEIKCYSETMTVTKLAKVYLKNTLKQRVLFINQKQSKCSIWASGKMVYNLVSQNANFDVDYIELKPGNKKLPKNYDIYLFNWHYATLNWFNQATIKALPGLKLTIILEVSPNNPFALCPKDFYNYFDGFIVLDPTIKNDGLKVFSFPRPLENMTPTVKYEDSKIPIIGSFGFGTPGKGFELVIDAVNKEFDRAIVKINIPYGTHVSDAKATAIALGNECIRRAKSGIEVIVTHDYLSEQELLDWCALNTLNCFLYNRDLPGLAATTDQAILSLRPLLVSYNDTFRHITKYIPPYPEWTLKRAIADSLPIVEEIKKDWSPDQFQETFDEMIKNLQLNQTDDKVSNISESYVSNEKLSKRVVIKIKDHLRSYPFIAKTYRALKRKN